MFQYFQYNAHNIRVTVKNLAAAYSMFVMLPSRLYGQTLSDRVLQIQTICIVETNSERTFCNYPNMGRVYTVKVFLLPCLPMRHDGRFL